MPIVSNKAHFKRRMVVTHEKAIIIVINKKRLNRVNCKL